MAAAGGEAAQQAQGNGNGDTGGEAAQSGPDLSALAQQLEAVAGGQEELRTFLSQHPALQTQQETEAAPAAPDIDLSWLDQDTEADPAQMQERIQQSFAQYVSHAVEQANAPVMERMQAMQQETAIRDLVEEFPEIADPEVHTEVIRASQEYAQLLGQPQLGSDPRLWRLVFAAGRAFDAARQEGAEAPGAAHLEGGGGANPGGSQVDPADAIMNAGGKRGASVLPFN